MEQMKNALKALESAVLRLETAVHVSKKELTQSKEKIDEFKGALKTTYDRLDLALDAYKKGSE